MQATTLHVLHTPPHRALRRWLADSLRGLAQSAWRRYEEGQRRRAERATLRYLRQLDDHLLHDLGLDRSDLQSIAANPGDPTRRRA
jgi:uncharacterized protein YjiS (DUF1127 family)